MESKLFSKTNCLSRRAGNLKRKIRDEQMRRSMKRIKTEMAEIGARQKQIRVGQKEVREKFEEIRTDSAQLREETDLISKQTAENQHRLDLMLEIVKARGANDSAKDAQLTSILRELMTKRMDFEKKHKTTYDSS